MTTSTANLKPLPEPSLQAHLHRVYDSHDEYRGTDARYLDGVHRQPYSLTHHGPRKGLAVILGVIVVGAVVLWRVW